MSGASVAELVERPRPSSVGSAEALALGGAVLAVELVVAPIISEVGVTRLLPTWVSGTSRVGVPDTSGVESLELLLLELLLLELVLGAGAVPVVLAELLLGEVLVALGVGTLGTDSEADLICARWADVEVSGLAAVEVLTEVLRTEVPVTSGEPTEVPLTSGEVRSTGLLLREVPSTSVPAASVAGRIESALVLETAGLDAIGAAGEWSLSLALLAVEVPGTSEFEPSGVVLAMVPDTSGARSITLFWRASLDLVVALPNVEAPDDSEGVTTEAVEAR